MDIRSTRNVEPEGNHQDTAPTYWLVPPRAMRDETLGGHLELVAEFEVASGGSINPHSHPTHEFYYVLAGNGQMTIDDETRNVGVGDLIRIPPDAVHSLKADGEALRCLAFAVAVPGAPPIDYISE